MTPSSSEFDPAAPEPSALLKRWGRRWIQVLVVVGVVGLLRAWLAPAPQAPPTLAEVVVALGSSDPRVRRRAVLQVEDVEEADPRDLVSAYELVLEDADPDVRKATAWRLAALDPVAASDAREALKRALRDPEVRVRIAALRALSLQEPREEALEFALGALEDPHRAVRRQALRSLSQIQGREQIVLAAAHRGLEDPDARVRARAAVAMGSPGAVTLSAISSASRSGISSASSASVAGRFPWLIALKDRLADSSGSVRSSAQHTLIGLGKAPLVVEVLTASLSDEAPEIRLGAALVLGRIPSPALAVSALLNALEDPDARVRAASAGALARFGGRVPQAMPALARLALTDPDREARFQGVAALAQLGPIALPSQFALLSNPDKRVRGYVAGSLAKAGPAALRPLIAALESPSPLVRLTAVHALRYRQPLDPEAIPGLIRGLESSDPDLRRACAVVLGQHGVQAVAALPALRLALQDRRPGVRGPAVHALATVGANRRETPTEVLSLFSDPDRGVRQFSQAALRVLGESARARGQPLHWVLPYAYRRELICIGLTLVLWFGFARLGSRYVQKGRRWRALCFLGAWLPAASAVGFAAGWIATRFWAQTLLPEPFLSVLPLSVTAVLSTSFACALAALWASLAPKARDASEGEAAA